MWHDRAIEDIAAEIGADTAKGLASDEARRRLKRDGPNELRKSKSVSPLTILLRQFTSLVIGVLIG
ncbi:MAG: cation-transporting P-type ATPase, partial [Gammaproteobacteria bacterium]